MRKKNNPNKRRAFERWKYGKYIFCIGAGVLLYLMAEIVDARSNTVEKGKLLRNDCGKGDAVYEFYVEGLEEDVDVVTVQVPDRKLTEEQFREKLPEMAELLCSKIVGENLSLSEVRSDLELVKELPEYGVTVVWKSENPEVVSDLGTVEAQNEMEVYLEATLTNGIAEEVIGVPVMVYPQVQTKRERFLNLVEEIAALDTEKTEVILPVEFEGQKLTYRSTGQSQNQVLVLLGAVAAACLVLKEKVDRENARKQREASLMEDYPDLISGFLILTGAGYPAKAAWKKLTQDYLKSGKKGFHPLFEEMQIAVNQMETGTPEVRAYADFGRRCGIRCYIKFASLLEGNVSTGGKNLRRLLEDEMEEAFKQRTDIAKRKGEEASSKLLVPMFGMLGVVMVMVVAPAFLTIG